MANIKYLVSSTIIIIYACIIIYILLGIDWRKIPRKNKICGIIFFVFFIALNISAQIVLGYQLYGKFYFLITQLPVYVLFLIISEYRGIKLFFVLLTAVFFSSPMMFLIFIIKHFIVPPLWVYLLCFLMSTVLIDRFFKKSFNYMLIFADNTTFVLFTFIPLLYYIYSYSLTQYQLADRIVNKQYFIEHIPMLMVLISYILLAQIFKMVSEKKESRNSQNLVSAQLNAAEEQIEQLRIAERQSNIYRHDLRHHMNYLNACIAENKLHDATSYIKQTCADIDNMKVIQYSQNESVNLILSSYASKAKEKGIAVDIIVSATDFSRFQITDLCSLLSNAFENAIKSSSESQNPDTRYVNLRLYEKGSKLCLDIRNSYTTEPTFKGGVPVSRQNGHGIGVISMIHVIEKYDGVYRFSAANGLFTFQMLI